MNIFRADLHIHTVLSPCGDLEMSPGNIIEKAKQLKLDIIGITDHNSTKHCSLVRKLGNEAGIFVLQGAEVTTREEVHCLTFFEDTEQLNEFQQYLDEHLPFVRNNPDYFGYQVVVDEQENILDEIEPLLILGLDQSIEEVERKVRMLEGLFIPAHVDRPHNGMLSQLGFLPGDLLPDAIELNGTSERIPFLTQHPEFSRFSLLKNSDAHALSRIGSRYNELRLEQVSFREIGMALHNENGREVVVA